MNISWLVPRLIEGSGGHRTILEHAKALEQEGYNCYIYLEDSNISNIEAQKKIIKYFGYHFANVTAGWEKIQPCDAVFATIWYSVYFIRSLSFDCQKLYFIQDYEALFNPMGDAFIAAENSYMYGLIPITIGRYLTYKLNADFGIFPQYFDFGANLNIYTRQQQIKDRENAVCFIYQPEKPRRCAKLGLQALAIVKQFLPDTKIFLYGSQSHEKGNIPFAYEHLGLLNAQECNALYNKCSVGLCISASNPSRIPFEMMAAGLPVVELWRENTLYDFQDNALLLSKQTAEALAANIIRLLNDPALRIDMSQAAVDFMAHRSNANETNQFVAIINQQLKGEGLHFKPVTRLYHSAPASDLGMELPCLEQTVYKRQPSHLANKIPSFLHPPLRFLYRKFRRYLAGL